jgi:hypothetical protein
LPKRKAENLTRIFIVDETGVSSNLGDIVCRDDFAATAFAEEIKAFKAARCPKPDLLIAEGGMSPYLWHRPRDANSTVSARGRVLLCSGGWNSQAPLQAAHSRRLDSETISKPVDPKELLKNILEMTTGTLRRQLKNAP